MFSPKPLVSSIIVVIVLFCPLLAVSARDGGYLVQLASFKRVDGPDKSWPEFSRAFPSLLDSFSPLKLTVDLGPEKGVFHRLAVGPLSKDRARELCSRLKDEGADCIVIPNGPGSKLADSPPPDQAPPIRAILPPQPVKDESPPPLKPGKSSFSDADKAELTLVFRGKTFFGRVQGYDNGRNVFLPLSKVVKGLDFAIEVNHRSGQAIGWFIATNRTFKLDLAKSEAVVESRKKPFSRDLVRSGPDDLYVALDLLEQWFPVDFRVVRYLGKVFIRPREELPFERTWAWRKAKKMDARPLLSLDAGPVVLSPDGGYDEKTDDIRGGARMEMEFEYYPKPSEDQAPSLRSERTGAVMVTVFQDRDGDGKPGPSESGLADVLVRLPDLNRSKATDSSGRAFFAGLPGSRRIQVLIGPVPHSPGADSGSGRKITVSSEPGRIINLDFPVAPSR